MKLYVTYGWGYKQRSNYSVVEGADMLACMDTIGRVCGSAYAFTYKEADFNGQVGRYGLTEIPLQPQTRHEYEYRGFTIRSDMLTALETYVEHGVPVGDFLRNVICNDLKNAVGHADDDNLRNLPAFVGWFYNEAPMGCHGSEQAYLTWIDDHAAKRDERLEGEAK